MEQQLDQSNHSPEGQAPIANNGESFATAQHYENTGVDWRANLSPDLQSVMQRFNNPEDLAKAYMDAHGLVSKKVGDFSQEDWQKYSAMQEMNSNIPQTVDGYDIDFSQEEGRYNTFTEEDVSALKEVSHAMGLNKTQAQQLYNVMNEVGNRIIEQHGEAADYKTQTSLQELDRDWGNAYQSKLDAANVCIEHILPKLTGVSSEAIREEMSNLGFEGSSIMLKALAALGELGYEGGGTGYNNVSPMDAAMRFDHFKNDPRTAEIMTNPRHPQYQQVRDEFRALSSMVHGEK